MTFLPPSPPVPPPVWQLNIPAPHGPPPWTTADTVLLVVLVGSAVGYAACVAWQCWKDRNYR